MSPPEDFSSRFSSWLCSPPPGDEVVVSGVSGRLPESRNVEEFRDHLFAKEDMVTEDDRRWTTDHPEIPKRNSKIYDIDRCDAGYFGLHYRQANQMDPLLRGVLETAVEAVMDAGVNPEELAGTRTGVFVSASWSDGEHETFVKMTEPQNFAVTGYLRSLLAQRIAYHLKLKGPSFIVDTACSSSSNALEHALRAIRNGTCENAIVGGCNILLNPACTLQFFRLGVLSRDGACKVFDDAADGYVRGESIVTIFLQKAKNARRIYAQIVNSKVNGDGFKEQGITFPSTVAQQQLIHELYRDSNIHPSALSYMEAHGTGTSVGDPQEVDAIDNALAKKRQEALLIGSVKSSIGHTEPVSGLCSLVKVVIAMQEGVIPANIHFKNMNRKMEGVLEGRIKVVDEHTLLEKEDVIVGLNNFGFGGNNCHVILRRFKKGKVGGGVPKDDLPRLVCVSGRTGEAVDKLLTNLAKNFDSEYICLFHHLYRSSFKNHLHRGFTILSKNGVVTKSSKFAPSQEAPLYVFFGQFINKFKVLGSYLSQFPVFKDTISRIDTILLAQRLKTFEEMLKQDTESNENILGSMCVQIGFVDLLKHLEINPVGVYGDSFSKIPSAYFHEVLSLEETVLAAVKASRLDLKPELGKEGYFTFATNNHKIEKGDYLNHESLLQLSKNSFVLNVSDCCLGNKDLLLVEGGAVTVLEVFGRLYEQGHNPQLHRLYPKVQFPVSRGTPMISPSLKWNHDKSWYTYKFKEFEGSVGEQVEHVISLFYDEYKFIEGHVIDGRNLFPATEYLHLVWKTFAIGRHTLLESMQVIFTDCKFIRAVTMPKSGYLKMSVVIQRGTGKFEVLEKNSLVVSGFIHAIDSYLTDLPPIQLDEEDRKNYLEKDEIYRELYLRGYNYSGVFKGIERCNVEGTSGLIKWEHNWSSFMDKMLQMQILKNDLRLLFVPTGIKKLIIDPVKHSEYLSSDGGEEALIPVYVYSDSHIIKSGGIEIHGLQAKSISKKRSLLEPVLEKHIFIPNRATLTLPEAIRVNTQLILENSLETKFKAVELLAEDLPLLPLVSQSLDDTPVVTPDLTISTKKDLEETVGVKVKDVILSPDSKLLLLVGSRFLQKPTLLKQHLECLNDKGYVLSREEPDFSAEIPDVEVLTEFVTGDEKLVLLRKREVVGETSFVRVGSDKFEWLADLRMALREERNVVVFSKIDEGVLGLVNCLRREPNGHKVRCVFTMDEVPEFDPQLDFYKEQLSKNMAVNVYKDGVWGTYKHLRLEAVGEIDCEHCYANVKSRGDLSSFKWFEGPFTQNMAVVNDKIFVSVYNSAVNFKDIMVASGRVNVETLVANRIEEQCPIGIEFAGKDLSGRRVTGMVVHQGLSNYVLSDNYFCWEIPNHWTIEDAATIPVVYSTVLYSLKTVDALVPGTSILIHSGTGGIGLAAITVCLHHKLDIYVTVGTQEKRDYLKKHYPQINPNHIGNSRDTSFEEMVKRETGGRGVDVVLNSLSDDKLKASIRCLAPRGRFLEIGKFDLSNDASLELLFVEKGASHHGIMLDRVFNSSNYLKSEITDLVREGIVKGYVKPLPRVVFKMEEVEVAFRYMMTGKHIGKVLLKIREEEKEGIVVPERVFFKASPRFNCQPEKSYVILGGLGGVGLELADWLVIRGAKKLLLVSRSGIQSGYQVQRIRIWQTYNVEVKVSTKDITTKQGCIDILEEAAALGPVDGVFNLAVVLKDALFEDQTEEMFKASLLPKAQATKHLDEVTRVWCPELRYFVIFSSVSCGRGNAGQTNYGMSNSIMERICEKRKQEGLPATAIQWGAIGDVGLVAKMQKENKELVIGGTLQQKIASCCEVLDILLKQDCPVVSSMVVAEKHTRSHGVLTAVETIANLLGVRDLKTISQHATFAELGMDSMTGTEIIQLLEKDYDIFVTVKDIRSLTFAKLSEMELEKKSGNEEVVNKTQEATKTLIQSMPDGSIRHLSTITLPSQAKENDRTSTVFLLTGIEGTFKCLEPLAQELKAHVVGVTYNYDNPENTVQEVAVNTLLKVEPYLVKDDQFIFIGYSFGAVIALEVTGLLEERGYKGKVILLDGSPTYSSNAAKEYSPFEEEAQFQTAFIYNILAMIVPIEKLLPLKEKVLKCRNLDERISLALTIIPPEVLAKENIDKEGSIALFKRFKATTEYTFDRNKIKSEVHLFKAKYGMIKEEEDYQLSKFCEKLVNVTVVDGDHVTILTQAGLAHSINEIIT